jgi:hypothetical protein
VREMKEPRSNQGVDGGVQGGTVCSHCTELNMPGHWAAGAALSCHPSGKGGAPCQGAVLALGQGVTDRARRCHRERTDGRRTDNTVSHLFSYFCSDLDLNTDSVNMPAAPVLGF